MQKKGQARGLSLFRWFDAQRGFPWGSAAVDCRARRTQPGSRQQPVPHGPWDGGGQLEAIGSDDPFADGRAGALRSFSIFTLPHSGQAGFSLLRTSSSNWDLHGGQWNSKSGIGVAKQKT
ncbi:hypothetical protein Pan44_36430 [Caulifigura coniformis]|uniref:Uncharacterized protein n=1 Tax=Caulifigura coniformis TaxID=2527983 RepID=A0A517SHM6_9PLAN|nr:hypothetical protein Pan44_36430 [Caulifigura coniformis]